MSALVSEEKFLRTRISGTSDFAFTALPTVAVTLPDGEAGSPGAVISTPAYNVVSAYHDLEALLEYAQAGIYSVRWTYQAGGQTQIAAQTYVATWTDVCGGVRDLLQKTAAQLPDASIDLELARTLRKWGVRYACAGYSALTGDDRIWYDEALTYMVAARLRRSYPAQYGQGALKRSKQGPVEYEYFNASGAESALGVSVEDSWLASASEALQNIACLAASAGWRDELDVYTLAGPRIGSLERVNTDEAKKMLYDMLMDRGLV